MTPAQAAAQTNWLPRACPQLLEFASIEGAGISPLSQWHWVFGCLGITEHCSQRCEDEFALCLENRR